MLPGSDIFVIPAVRVGHANEMKVIEEDEGSRFLFQMEGEKGLQPSLVVTYSAVRFLTVLCCEVLVM